MLASEGWKWEQDADGKGGTLTLRNFYLYGTPESAAAFNAYNHMWLCLSGDVTVVLEGTNVIEINDPYYSAIIGTHCGDADDLHMTIREGASGGSLEVKLADGVELSSNTPYATAQSFKLESGTVKTNMWMGYFGTETVEVAGGLLDIDITAMDKLLPNNQSSGIDTYNTALVVSGGKLRINGGNYAPIYLGSLPGLAGEQAPSLTVKGSGSLELTTGANYGAYVAGDINIDTTGDVKLNASSIGLLAAGSINIQNVGSYENTARTGLALTASSTGKIGGRSADYTAVDAALAKVPADLTAYTKDTADAVTAAVSAVIRGKLFLEQTAVDRMAADLEAAVAALKPVPTEVSGTSADGKITATVRKVDGKTGIDLSNTTVEVVRMTGTLYGSSYNRGYAVVVKVNGALCQNWVAGENTLSLSAKLEDGEILGQLGTWIWANGNYTGGVNAFKDKDAKFSNYTVSEDGVATVEVIPAALKATSNNNATCNRLLQEMDRASTAAKATPIGSGDRTSYIGLNTRKTVEPVVTNFFADGQAHAGLKQGSAFKVRVDGVLMAAHYVEATRVIDGVTDTYKYGLYTLDSDFAKQTAPGTYSVKVYIDNSKVVYDNYTWADGTTAPKTITWIIGEKAAKPAAVEGLVYNGESQTGVAAGEGYTLTGETAINAGSHTATAMLAEGYLWEDGSAESVEITYTIAKADPAVSVDALTAAFGQKLSDLTLPDGFAWVNGDTELTTVGELTFPAVYTPADTENYNTAELSVTVNVLPKAAAAPAAIEGLVYNGESQTGVAAGEGYTLTGETATNAGSHTATAALKPGYIWADGTTEPVQISYTIAKADPAVSVEDIRVPYGTKLGELTLEDGFAWADGTDLETALTEGSYTVSLIYTPADTENYNTAVLTAQVIVAARAFGTPVIAEGSGTEWAYGASAGLTIKVDGNPGQLLGVSVDGAEIPEASFTAGEDTVVLHPDYLQTLSKGEHTLTLRYEGGSADASFTVKDGVREVLVTRLKPGTYTVTANIWFEKADSGLPMNPHLTNSSFPPKDPVTDNATLRVDANGRALVTVPIVIQSKVMTIQKITGLNIAASTRDANGNLTSVTIDLGVLENFSDVITKLCTISLKMGDLAMSISGFDRDQTWRAHFQVNLAGVPTEQVTKTITIGQNGTEAAPETGDSSSAALFAGTMAVSLLAAAVLVCSRKRRAGSAD